MQKIAFVFLPLVTMLVSQNLPDSWSPSYCTYDIGTVHATGKYSLGFGIDNYCIYNSDGDTIPYDERRFDIFATLGLWKNIEVELKYSFPTAAVIAIKYRFLHGIYDAAFKIGFGYMKGTRRGYITDYVYDFYPTLIVSKHLCANWLIYCAPKIIYSVYTRDRQEHSNRAPRHVLQYGVGVGLKIGRAFSVFPEINWLWGNNEGVHYIVNQFGVGVNLNIH
jgi:hypothetical protein